MAAEGAHRLMPVLLIAAAFAAVVVLQVSSEDAAAVVHEGNETPASSKADVPYKDSGKRFSQTAIANAEEAAKLAKEAYSAESGAMGVAQKAEKKELDDHTADETKWGKFTPPKAPKAASKTAKKKKTAKPAAKKKHPTKVVHKEKFAKAEEKVKSIAEKSIQAAEAKAEVSAIRGGEDEGKAREDAIKAVGQAGARLSDDPTVTGDLSGLIQLSYSSGAAQESYSSGVADADKAQAPKTKKPHKTAADDVTAKMLASMKKRAQRWEKKAANAGLKHEVTKRAVERVQQAAGIAKKAYGELRGAAAVASIASDSNRKNKAQADAVYAKYVTEHPAAKKVKHTSKTGDEVKEAKKATKKNIARQQAGSDKETKYDRKIAKQLHHMYKTTVGKDTEDKASKKEKKVTAAQKKQKHEKTGKTDKKASHKAKDKAKVDRIVAEARQRVKIAAEKAVAKQSSPSAAAKKKAEARVSKIVAKAKVKAEVKTKAKSKEEPESKPATKSQSAKADYEAYRKHEKKYVKHLQDKAKEYQKEATEAHRKNHLAKNQEKARVKKIVAKAQTKRKAQKVKKTGETLRLAEQKQVKQFARVLNRHRRSSHSQVAALIESGASGDISRSGKSVTKKMLKDMDKRAKKWEGKAKSSATLKKHHFTAKEIKDADTVAKVADKAYDEERGAAAVAHIADKAAYRAMQEAIAGATAKTLGAKVDRDVANDKKTQDELRKLTVGESNEPSGPASPAAPSPSPPAPPPVLDPEAHPHLHHKMDEGHPEMEPASHGGHDESTTPSMTGPKEKGTLKEVKDVLKSDAKSDDKLAKIRNLVGEGGLGKAAGNAGGLSDDERQKILDSHENALSHVKDELARSKEQINAARDDYHHGVQKQIENEMVRAAQKSVLEARRHATEVAKNAGVQPSTAAAQATKAVKAAAQQSGAAA